MKTTGWSTALSSRTRGSGIINHTGAAALRLAADRTGLTAGFSQATLRAGFQPRVHDPGAILRDLAVMLADGGQAIEDLKVLRDQGELFGPVASTPTAWRALEAITPNQRQRLWGALNKAHRRAWALAPNGVPVSKCANQDLGSTIVIDIDASVVAVHSEKEEATATFKRTFGYNPLLAFCDNTGELLAGMMRPGRAGSNTATDHIQVLTDAINAVPGTHRKDLLIRCDGAGASHALLDWLTEQASAVRGRKLEYSVGFSLTTDVKSAISALPATAWTPAVNQDGHARAGADVAELTGLMDLGRWPSRMRVITRRERPHPGAQLSLFEEHDGYRYQVFVTNTPTGAGGSLALLEARHRAHARVEDRIRTGKDTGLTHFPSRHYGINQTWLVLIAAGINLIAVTRLLAFHGPAAALSRLEPKRLRYQFLHTGVRLVRTSRRRELSVPVTWPWAHAITAVLTALLKIPIPA